MSVCVCVCVCDQSLFQRSIKYTRGVQWCTVGDDMSTGFLERGHGISSTQKQTECLVALGPGGRQEVRYAAKCVVSKMFSCVCVCVCVCARVSVREILSVSVFYFCSQTFPINPCLELSCPVCARVCVCQCASVCVCALCEGVPAPSVMHIIALRANLSSDQNGRKPENSLSLSKAAKTHRENVNTPPPISYHSTSTNTVEMSGICLICTYLNILNKYAAIKARFKITRRH